MFETVLNSNRDTLIFGLPMLGVLMAGLFGLEQSLFRTTKAPRKPRNGTARKLRQAPLFTDPDGRPVAPQNHGQ